MNHLESIKYFDRLFKCLKIKNQIGNWHLANKRLLDAIKNIDIVYN